ncbi:MAG: SPOR domain-containing protein [Endozoicomonas sp.]
MSGPALFTDKPLRLGVVAVLATLTAFTADAILLPPKPLAMSSAWDCKAGPNSDWLCRKNQHSDYRESLEVTRVLAPQTTQPSLREQPPPVRTRAVDAMPGAVEYQRPQPVPVDNTGLVQLLSAPHGSYVLQWLAANTRESLQALQQRYPALRESSIVHYRRNNRDWFVLLDGPFSDRQSASAALNSPRRSSLASHLYPWIRSVASIQKLDLIRPDTIDQLPWQREQQQLAWQNNQPQHYNNTYAERNGRQRIAQMPQAQSYYDQNPGDQRYTDRAVTGYEYSSADIPRNSAARQRENSALFASISPAYPQMDGYEQPRPRQRSHNSGYDSRFEPDMNDSYSRYGERAHIEDYNRTSRPGSRTNRKPVRPQAYSRDDYRERQNGYSQHSTAAVSDYNETSYAPPVRDRNFGRYREPETVRRERDYGYEATYDRGWRENILDASEGSYTIEWLSGPRRSTLERTKRRYPALADSQIIQYRNRDRNWYVLVSNIFPGQAQAVRGLHQMDMGRMGTRLSPWIRSVDGLRKLVRDSHRRLSHSRSRQSDPVQSIISAPKNSYTIQWFAANRPEAIKKMQQRFPELASAVTVHFRRNQKDWYVLLQGQYTDSREALSAIKSPLLKDAARVLHPWTRPLNSLKNVQIQES